VPVSWDDVGRTPTSVRRHIDARPEHVFALVADAWLYPVWVVGAVHIRAVDDSWPEPGAHLYHQVGAWPITISDSTEVVDLDAPRRLVLRGRAWPFGEACIEIIVEPEGATTQVTMNEAPVKGPPSVVDNPLQRKLLASRNRESLDRLAAVAENRR
jgi:uncharacterized protein YndB with AHSA1/START domain